MTSENVQFSGGAGHELSGIVDHPQSDPTAYALFAHCFTCSKNLKAVANISGSLVHAGIAVLRFDFTGLGNSDGDFSDTNFSSNVGDLIAAANFLDQHFRSPELLIGHSLGGTAMLQAAGSIPSAAAVVTIGSPLKPSHVARHIGGDRALVEQQGQATVDLGGRPFVIKKQFLDDLEKHSLPSVLKALRQALLVMHAPLDDIVAIDDAGDLFTHAKHPKSFVSLGGADHLMSRDVDSKYAGRVIAAWASRYLTRQNSDRASGRRG